jgi:hypothetical protein
METSALIIIKQLTSSTISGFALRSNNSLTIITCPLFDANNKADDPSYETTTININNK